MMTGQSLMDIFVNSLQETDNLKAVKELQNLSLYLQQDQVFSRNESLVDLGTNSLLLLSTFAYLVKRCNQLNLKELETLQKSRIELLAFITNVNSVYFEWLKVYELRKWKAPKDRDSKVVQFKRSRVLTAKLQSALPVYLVEGGKGALSNEDDEDIRAIYIDLIELLELELISIQKETEMETSLLKHRETLLKDQPKQEDAKEDTSMRLDYIPKKPTALLSADGKVLQPFIITNSFDARQQLHDRVFGDRNLPTMSVEEYINREIERGNFLSGGANANQLPKEESEESEEEDGGVLLDKKRQFDEFKDNNPRGWGNRHNKG